MAKLFLINFKWNSEFFKIIYIFLKNFNNSNLVEINFSKNKNSRKLQFEWFKKMKYFGCWREGCDNGLVIQRPFGVCVSFFEFLFERRRWEEKAGCWRGASAGGRCAGDIDRNIKVSFCENKGKHRLCALNAIINISTIFRNFIQFFKKIRRWTFSFHFVTSCHQMSRQRW